MSRLRRLLHAHRCLAAMLIACALLVKAVVPAGYMIVSDHRDVVVSLCSGSGADTMTLSIPMKPGHQHDRSGGKAEMPCAFAGLAMAGLASTTPTLLAALILFIMRTAVRTPSRTPDRSAPRLRPPLRGPPLTA